MTDEPADAAFETATEPGPPSRPPCPAPADFAAEIAAYDRAAQVVRFDGPRHRMTARVLGQGPPLILCPGIAATYRGYALVLNRLAERFRTVVFDYPGEHRDDRARLGRISHDDLVDDVFQWVDHLNIGRAFLFGPSFGSTIVFKALAREPRRFPRVAVQGAFARRTFTAAERFALTVGRHFPGQVGRLPLHGPIMRYNNQSHFPHILADRWEIYLQENAVTPVAALSHRLDLVSRLDVRPLLPTLSGEILLLQGNEDRIIPRRHFDELREAMPGATAVLMPLVGHQPHYTHAEALAGALADFFLPCNPEGCPSETRPDA